MSFLHLTSTRTRTRDRSPSPSLFSRPLVRRDTKRSRIITLSDDEDDADDYPYSSSHRPVRPSRALTLRNAPSQLERYNVWSDRHKSEDRDDTSYERERELERTREYHHSHAHRHRHHHHHHHDDSDVDDEERAFRLRVRATFSRPHHHHHHHHEVHDHHLLPSLSSFRRKDKWVDEGWETRERSRSRSRSRETRVRRDSFWGEGGFWGTERVEKDKDSEDEKDVWRRYHKIKRTKTEEWRPLTGWRRV